MFPRKELKRKQPRVYMVTAHKSLSLEGAGHLGALKNLSSVHLSARWKTISIWSLNTDQPWHWVFLSKDGKFCISSTLRDSQIYEMKFQYLTLSSPCSSQSQLPFSVITTHQHHQTPCFVSLPFMYFQLCIVSLYPQDCNSFGQVHRLNQHIEICSSTKQQPGAFGSHSSQ